MFERFTSFGRDVVVHAQEEARDLKHSSIGSEHLLLGLMRDPVQLSTKVLHRLGLGLENARDEIKEIVPTGERVTAGSIPFTPRANAVLEQALRESLSLGHDWIGSEHILLALAKERDGVAARILERHEASDERVRDETLRLMAAGDATRPPAEPGAPAAPEPAREAAPRFAGPFDPGAQAHLLLGLISAGGAVSEFLAAHGVTAEATRAALTGD